MFRCNAFMSVKKLKPLISLIKLASQNKTSVCRTSHFHTVKTISILNAIECDLVYHNFLTSRFSHRTFALIFDIFYKINLIFSVFRLKVTASCGGKNAGSTYFNSRFITRHIDGLGRHGQCSRAKRQEERVFFLFFKLKKHPLSRPLNSPSGLGGKRYVLKSTNTLQLREYISEKFASSYNLTCNGPDFDCVKTESSV